MALLLCVATARADEFDTLRLKWRDLLTQGTNASPADPLYAGWIADVAASAQREWTKLNTNVGRTNLWSDLQTPGSDSGDVTSTYERLRSMTMGYAVRGSTLESNAALRADIISALDWMYTNAYNETTVEYDNFFDWEIGAPINLNDITVLLYPHLSAGQVTRYMNTVNHFTPAPTLTGANEVWQCLVVGLRGAIVKNSAKLSAARLALSDVFPYVTTGDGFYEDGSFVFHSIFPYNTGYGANLIETMGPLMQWLKGSTWEITDPAQTNLYRWIYDSFEPFLHRGAAMQMVSGRYYTRDGDDHQDGQELIGSILRIAQFAPAADAAAFRALAKREILSDSYRDFIAHQPPPYNVWAQAALNDTNLAPRAALVGHYQFPGMDRVVHRRPGWSFGLALSSSRTGNYESTQGENLRGWYTGDGMTYLYQDDLAHYADDFWPTVDSYRLPGTTVDTQTRSNGSGEGYLSPNSGVGGTSLLGQYGVAGLHLNAWNSTLSARKSWFMFDDEIVCLGAGITSTDGRSVETIIDNRRLAALGNNPFTVNGVARPTAVGWTEVLNNVSTAHVAGNVPGADLGFYFPSPAAFNVRREVRAGALSDINSTYGSTNIVARNFLTLWCDHGVNPSNVTYAYVLLPNQSAAGVEAYSSSPHITVIENTTRAQAVRENRLGLTAINFWRDGTNRIGGITSDRRASVIQRNDGSILDLSVTDPTQTNTSVINVELTAVGQAVLSADASVTVLQLSPTIKLAINVAGAAGASHRARFFVGPVTTLVLSPVADSYAQNGPETNSNFGTSISLAVKASGSTLARESFLRFDVSQASGQLFGATLRLLPFTTNEPIQHALAFVTNNTWSEGGLNWNNRPASGPELMRWNVPVQGTPVLLPVVPQVGQARSGDGLLSFKVSSTGTPPPGSSFVAYGSKEHGTAGNRPQLILTLGRMPPTVSLTSPPDGGALEAPASITLAAEANDADGVVTNVTFYCGSVVMGQDSTAPYEVALAGCGPGQYTFTSVALDHTGLAATSAPVSVSIYAPEPPGRGNGLIAEYYTNPNLTGLGTTRIDAFVDFAWGNGSPLGGIPGNHFSVRWLGKLQARRSGQHVFHVTADDGARLWVGGQLVVDRWFASGLGEGSASVPLVAGEYYDLQLEFMEAEGGASVSLAWTQPSAARETIPQAQLYAADEGLRASYFSGTALGSLVFTRIDEQVNFQWGDGSPDPLGLPGGFSVRWNGKVRAKQGGSYTFHTLSDDGVRLYVNNVLLIDDWTAHAATENSNTITLAAGQTYNLTMDFFSNPGGATAVLMWTPPGETKHVIPRFNLTPHQNNHPPALAALPHFNAGAGSALQFNASARDPETPVQSVGFSLDAGAPAGAMIHPTSGAFTWTPSQAQAGGSFNVVVRATDSGVPAMSDAQTFVITVLSNVTTASVTLIPTGSVWRYLDTGMDQGTAWRERVFDDATWKIGPGVFGYGNGDEATLLSFGPNPAGKHITTYFRREVVLPDAALVQSLTARLLRNDGAAVYLNGVEVWRDNLPAGPLSSSTLAVAPLNGPGAATFMTMAFNSALLVSGTNVLAVEIHQESAAGPDVRFDFELTGTALVPEQAEIDIAPFAGGARLTWPAEAGLLQLYTASSLSPPILWRRTTNAPFLSNGVWTLVLPPTTNRTQFFRLQAP